MFEPEVIHAIVIAEAIVMAIVIPMMLADTVFGKRGREVASAVCYMIGFAEFTTVLTVGLIKSIHDGHTDGIAVFLVMAIIGLALTALQIVSIVTEVKKRRKVAAETLF